MSNMKALGCFMDYCNRHAGESGIDNTTFQWGMSEILNSSEGRFSWCRQVSDILSELGLDQD